MNTTVSTAWLGTAASGDRSGDDRGREEGDGARALEGTRELDEMGYNVKHLASSEHV